VRIPIPLVLLLSLAVIGAVWWFGTRNSDFLTPPPASKLVANRTKIESSLPPADPPDDTVAVPAVVAETTPPPPVEEPKPTIVLGDLNSPPTLQEYSDLAPKGAAHLMDLAGLLETEGAFQRALLAWERVLDMGQADASQASTAIAAIKRLRPTLPDWNTERAGAIAITLHAGTGKKFAKTLTPVLEKTARELESASSGILKVTATITTGRDRRSTTGRAPMVIWFTGPKKNSASTAVLTFSVGSPQSLGDDLLKTVALLVRSYLGETSYVTAATGDNPLATLNSHITRRNWQELGTRLNCPSK